MDDRSTSQLDAHRLHTTCSTAAWPDYKREQPIVHRYTGGILHISPLHRYRCARELPIAKFLDLGYYL